MRVIIGCELSQIVMTAFLEKGHDAYSCDTQPCEGNYPERHFQEDILGLLKREQFDFAIFHPDCGKLCFSGEQWRTPGHKNYIKGDYRLRLKALGFLLKLYNAPIEQICVENSHSVFINKYFRPADQIIQPWQFGEPHQKQTHLWLKGLPPLIYTGIIPRDKVEHTCWKMRNSKTRSKDRARSYQGIAKAMANQWG